MPWWATRCLTSHSGALGTDASSSAWRASAMKESRDSRSASRYSEKSTSGSYASSDTVRGSDVEAEGSQLLPAVVGDLVGAPRRHPDPVDGHVADETLERGVRLVLDDVGQRTGRRGQRHVEHGV